MRRIAQLIFGLALAIATPALAQDFPELSGRVVDQAEIIPADVEASLDAKLAALEQTTRRQLVVVTLASLGGYDIADYGYQLGRAWGIGDKERNDGALLIVAPNERKARIEVGYGLEPVLTDGLSSLIMQQQMIPRFRDDDYPGGIVAGTDAIIAQLQLPADEAQRIADEADRARESDSGVPVGTLVWIAFLFFFFILPMFGRRRRRRYRNPWGGAVSDIVLWEVGKAIARGASDRGGGWGGGGFGGGGGFSGGGGSFGGGGASGGW